MDFFHPSALHPHVSTGREQKKGYGVHMDRSVVGGIAVEKDVHINDSVTVCDFYLFLANELQIIQVKK